MGNQFEEEPELADFDSLLHDVHAEEVVDDDGFEDEIVLLGVALRFFENLLEVAEFRWVVRPRRLHVFNKTLHPYQAGFIERFEDIERGK